MGMGLGVVVLDGRLGWGCGIGMGLDVYIKE